jgi:hypothetical protein
LKQCPNPVQKSDGVFILHKIIEFWDKLTTDGARTFNACLTVFSHYFVDVGFYKSVFGHCQPYTELT